MTDGADGLGRIDLAIGATANVSRVALLTRHAGDLRLVDDLVEVGLP